MKTFERGGGEKRDNKHDRLHTTTKVLPARVSALFPPSYANATDNSNAWEICRHTVTTCLHSEDLTGSIWTCVRLLSRHNILSTPPPIWLCQILSSEDRKLFVSIRVEGRISLQTHHLVLNFFPSLRKLNEYERVMYKDSVTDQKPLMKYEHPSWPAHVEIWQSCQSPGW